MHRLNKTVILSILVLMILFCFVGCRTYTKGYEYSYTQSAMHKQHVGAYTGQSAACHNGRIYYVSQEGDKDGIYSMKDDGSDVRFELEAPKITRLIVMDDSIYYVGVNEIFEGEKHFGLYQYNRNYAGLQQVMYTEYPDSAYDAYVTEDGTICVLEVHGTTGSIAPDDYAYIYNNKEPFVSATVSGHCMIQRNDEVIYTGGILYDGYILKNMVSEVNCSFLDATTGMMVMDNMYAGDNRYFKALYAQDKKIWCSLNNSLLEIDSETLKINYIYVFDDDDLKDLKLSYMYNCKDIAYVIFEKRWSDVQWVYALDLERSAYNKIETFNSGKALLHIENGQIIWAQGNKIHCNSISKNGIGDTAYEIEMPQNIVGNNILEIAGDWLFIHKKAQAARTDTNQLLYKVNLKTQQIIDTKS
ncbi:MAG: hypothetical protein ACOX8Q_10415 [Christensenellales bacterium]|jgi:hypothetical protein